MKTTQIAIITGGSDGIGFAIASQLAQQGVHVYLVARTLEKLIEAQSLIRDEGGSAESISADITNIDAMKELIEEVYEKHGRLDIFVNNAGTWKGQDLSTPFSDIWKLIEFNMKAPYEITHHLAQRFQGEAQNHLKILTVISQAALVVLSSGLGYGAAKMGLAAGLFHIEKELEMHDIKNISLYRLYPNTVATNKILPDIKAGKVQNPVRVEAVSDAAIDLLEGATLTRDLRIGYYPGRGIVRTYFPSNPLDFYKHTELREEIVDPNFSPEDLF